MGDNDNDCAICAYVPNWTVISTPAEKLQSVGKRGIANMVKTSNMRQDGFHNHIQNEDTIMVHSKCRVRYIKAYIPKTPAKKRKISDDLDIDNDTIDPEIANCDGSSPITDSIDVNDSDSFDTSDAGNLSEICIVCFKKLNKANVLRSQRGKIFEVTEKTKEGYIEYLQNNLTVSSVDTRDLIVDTLLNAENVDELNLSVHESCRYVTYQKKTYETQSSTLSRQESVNAIIDYIDKNSNKIFPVKNLQDFLLEKNLYVPQNRYLLNVLQNHYKERIIIIKRYGSQTHCCLTDKGFDILKENVNEENELDETNILKKAAKILYNDIEKYEVDRKFYPPSQSMFEKAKEIPEKLEEFLKYLFLNNYKKSSQKIESRLISIAHAMMFATFPRKILSPLHIAVGVTFHRKFGSKELIDICHALGFSCSYTEARTYEISAALQGKIEIDEGAFVQFVHDNADWNVETLDGKGTFHSMGSIQIITPFSKVLPRQSFPRVDISKVKESDIAGKGKIVLQEYPYKTGNGLENYKFPEIQDNIDLNLTQSSKLFIFWMVRKYINPLFKGWNGYTDDLFIKKSEEKSYEVSEIYFSPFIHANPTDYNTIFTAIKESVDETMRLNMKTCVVTFDQPLYIKARDIVGAYNFGDEIKVVVRLGGFHTVLSFLGSIGFIMKDSGFEELLLTVYGENTVDKIITGHQYARALRAHSLVLLALVKKILKRIEAKNENFKKNIRLMRLHEKLIPTKIEELLTKQIFDDVNDAFHKEIQDLEKQNPTSQFWIQYCKIVFLLFDFIFAERTGDWDLHLRTVEKMIPLFHVSGHFAYAKSAQIYLDDMKKLEEEMDVEEFEKFTKKGFWTSRRSFKFFAGIFTDQTIEQTLMRLLKFQGGLFQRGVTESVAFQWIIVFIFVKDLMEGLEKFTKSNFDKNYQHKDAYEGRIHKDRDSLAKLEEFLEQFDPFSELNDLLINISNGMSCGPDVNCHEAFKHGLEIMRNISGTSYSDLKLKRKNLIKRMGYENTTIDVDDEKYEIDADQLFYRACIMVKDDQEMRDILKWEMSPYPQAYFNKFGMLKNTKSDLLKKFEKSNISPRGATSFYVIDGGFLLHKVKWTVGQHFSDILESYVRYIDRHYGKNVTVIFDGYEKLTIKSAERNRRAKSKASRDIKFNESMPLTISQEKFLLNSKNKNNLIKLLKNKFSEVGIVSRQCDGDADRTIVTTAIELAQNLNRKVVIVAEDTDVLVLLTALTPNNLHIFFLKPGRPNIHEAVYDSRSLNNNPTVKENILFLHAFTGCDTVSATLGKGKISYLKIFEKNKDLEKHAKMFYTPGLNIEELFEHGVQLLLAMYNAPVVFRKNPVPVPVDQIHSPTALAENYRYRMYLLAAGKNKKVVLGKILSSVDAFTQHLKRVYLQVQYWLYGEETSPLNPNDWGWQCKGATYIPIKMTQDAAPPQILKMIFCACAKGCGPHCGCRKQGLSCSIACKVCMGIDCTNAEKVISNEILTEIAMENNDDVDNDGNVDVDDDEIDDLHDNDNENDDTDDDDNHHGEF